MTDAPDKIEDVLKEIEQWLSVQTIPARTRTDLTKKIEMLRKVLTLYPKAPDKIAPYTEVGVIHKDRRSLDGIYFRDLHPWARARLEWNTELEAAYKSAQKRAEAAEELAEALGTDGPFDVLETLTQLRLWVWHLLRDHDCDHAGYERAEHAMSWAQKLEPKIRAALAKWRK